MNLAKSKNWDSNILVWVEISYLIDYLLLVLAIDWLADRQIL
jgi:hypothetical protein